MYLVFALKSWVFQGIPRHTPGAASGCEVERHNVQSLGLLVCVQVYTCLWANLTLWHMQNQSQYWVIQLLLFRACRKWDGWWCCVGV